MAHISNMQIRATEMYKLINKLSTPIMNRVFKLNIDSYRDLRQNFTVFHIFGKIGISQDGEYFLLWPKNMRYTI